MSQVERAKLEFVQKEKPAAPSGVAGFVVDEHFVLKAAISC
jgi:hypothetical protein